MKVLIVDDDVLNRKYLRVLLMQEGHTVFEGTDGIEALELLEHERVDADSAPDQDSAPDVQHPGGHGLDKGLVVLSADPAQRRRRRA